MTSIRVSVVSALWVGSERTTDLSDWGDFDFKIDNAGDGHYEEKWVVERCQASSHFNEIPGPNECD